MITKPVFRVVVSQQGRYSIWPDDRPIPVGWQATSVRGSDSECLNYIGREWNELNSPFGIRADRPAPPIQPRCSRMKLGLMFFGDTEGDDPQDKYRLVFDCARLADEGGLHALWLPERHFTRFGCLFPNPAVLHAALARQTRRIRLRAGSVVMPLNEPIRVAEQWAMVDNLSSGRVDLSFASGWHPDDFVLRPESYADRYDAMYRGIETFLRLWRGETLEAVNGAGQTIGVRTYPSPLQREPAIWLTAAGNPDTFARAGRMGFHVLTHLFDQRIDDLAAKVDIYRRARRQAGWDVSAGQVSVVMHTFIADSLESVRREAQQGYCRFLKSNLGLLKSLAFSRGLDADISNLPDDQLDELLNLVFEKFLGDRSLLGTPATCARTIDQLAAAGVTEVACLLDFGPSSAAIVKHLPHVIELGRQVAAVQPGNVEHGAG